MARSHGFFEFSSQAAGGVERGVFGDEAGMAEIDGCAVATDMNRLSVPQNQVLQKDARNRVRTGAGVELHGGERHVGLHRGRLIERTGDGGLALDEAIEGKVFAEVPAGGKIVQRSERDAGDGDVRFARDNRLPCAIRRSRGFEGRPRWPWRTV